MMNQKLEIKAHSAILMIETQNEWMHPEGKLNQSLVQDKEMLQRSITNIEKVVDFARANGIPLLHIGLRFQPNYPELAHGQCGLRKAIPQAGTFQINSFGAEFYKSIKPLAHEFVVTGRMGASGFAGSNLDVYLRNNKLENLYLLGYATHVCVESTLREAHDKGYHTFVLSDATAAFNQQQQDYFLKEILHHFGEGIVTGDFIQAKISKPK